MIALQGIEVAISGRLASMTRGEAAQLISKWGGQYVAQPTAHTRFVIVAQQDPNLLDPNSVLAQARRLQGSGAPIEFISEREFLRRVSTESSIHGNTSDADLSALSTAAELARLVGVSRKQIQTWVRRGLLTPTTTQDGVDYFDFGQLAVGRLLDGLVRGGARPSELRQRLDHLRKWLAEEVGDGNDPLSSDAIVTDENGQVRVKLDDGSVADDAGQLQFDFAPAEDAASEEPKKAKITQVDVSAEAIEARRQKRIREQLSPLPPHALGIAGGEPWFTTGSTYEEHGALEEAEHAYRNAIELEGERPETVFNLGNVLYKLERTAEAAQCYLTAVELDPGYVDAWGNLGIALTDLQQGREALAAFREALSIDPDHADTHYNIAETLYMLGRVHQAREHWRTYLEKDPSSPWANHVRHRLLQAKA